MKMIVAAVLLSLAAPSFADTKLVELPAGSTLRFTGRRSIPAGWMGVTWGQVTLSFNARLPNNLELSGELKTSGAGAFGELPCRATSDESRGRIGLCLSTSAYRIPLDSKIAVELEISDMRKVVCRKDAEGQLIEETIEKGALTVEQLNACMASIFEIVPNLAPIRP